MVAQDNTRIFMCITYIRGASLQLIIPIPTMLLKWYATRSLELKRMEWLCILFLLLRRKRLYLNLFAAENTTGRFDLETLKECVKT